MPPYSALYARMRDALNATGRPIEFYACVWGRNDVYEWGPTTANLWRTTGDILPRGGKGLNPPASWANVMSNWHGNTLHPNATGPGGWQDGDMLVVGFKGLTPTEWQSHFGLWAMAANPLWIGNDVTDPAIKTNGVLAMLKNADVLAIDQDALGRQATLRGGKQPPANGGQVWGRPLADGGVAVLLLNTGDAPSAPGALSVAWADMWPAEKAKGGARPLVARVRDAYAQKDLPGTFSGSFTVDTALPAHGSVLIRATLVGSK